MTRFASANYDTKNNSAINSSVDPLISTNDASRANKQAYFHACEVFQKSSQSVDHGG